MKKQVLIPLLFVLATSLYAQMDKKYYLGLHLSHGITGFSEFRSTFTGSQDYKGKNFSSLEVNYAYRTSETVDVGVGIVGTLYRLEFTSSYIGIGSSDYKETLGMLSASAYLKYRFGKYFYVNPGIRFNRHSTLGYNWGMGAFAGIGAEYTFTPGISVSIAPQVHINLLSIGGVDERDNNNFGNFEDYITGIGMNVGIGYRF